jgi:CrcB protein
VIAVALSLAGGAGAMARYLADHWITARRPNHLPWGTLAINVSGSFVLGIVTGLVIAHGAASNLRTVAGTGFCGGYTTFSAASVEAVRLAEERRFAESLGYSAASLVLSLLAAGLGLVLVGVH